MNSVVLSVLSVLAWGGAIGSVVAYALVTRGRLGARSIAFQGINTAAAALLGLNAMILGNWTSAASNVVWLVIGVQGLAVIGWTRRPAATVSQLRPAPSVEVLEGTAA